MKVLSLARSIVTASSSLFSARHTLNRAIVSTSRLCSIAAAIFIAANCNSTRAAFINNVEDFNGTSVDSTTWKPFFFANSAATVSNGYLDLSGQYYLATSSLTIGVGTPLVARVMLTSPSTELFLGITATPNNPQLGQNAYASLDNFGTGDSEFGFYRGTNGGSGAPIFISYNVGSWYRILFQRNTLSTYTTSLFTDSGTLVTSVNSTYSGLPAQAAVFMGLGPAARFDWVAVPEPASLALAMLASAAFLHRSKRSG
jgi:PEP-CTERM motif